MKTFGGEDAESYYDEGVTASTLGDLDRAIEYFEEAIKRDNTFVAAYHQVAKCYQRKGNLDRAIEILKHVADKRPSHIQSRVDLGFALLKAGDVTAAHSHFTRVLSMKPQHPKANLGLAHVYFQQNDWPAAVEQAQAARQLSEANFGVLYLLGRAARLDGNTVLGDSALEEAAGLVQQSIELNPEKPEGYFLLAEVYFAQDRFSSALEQYRKAEDCAKPGEHYSAFGEEFRFLDILVKEALCFQRLDKKDRARDIGKRILELEPGHKLGRSLASLE